MTLHFARDGAEISDVQVDVEKFLSVLSPVSGRKAGVRLRGISGLGQLVDSSSLPGAAVQKYLGQHAIPVRAILFDKNEFTNWTLDWHQDRTIAVAERIETEGYNNWSIKQGIHHVEPPFDILSKMVTIRIHLDDVGPKNAPLKISPGSHKFGRVREKNYSSIVKQCGEEVCLARAGEVWMYATPILHASLAAKVPTHRRVLQVDYSATLLPQGLDWAGL